MKSTLGKKRKKHVNSPRLKQEHLQHTIVYTFMALVVLGIWFRGSVPIITVESFGETMDTFDMIVARLIKSGKELATLGVVIAGVGYGWLQIFRKP